MQLGTLYLIPTTLGEVAFEEVLPVKIAEILEKCFFFFVENEKTARKFIKKVLPNRNLADIQLFLIDKHEKVTNYSEFLDLCLEGKSIGILSEAGCPAVADPGAIIVALAHQKNIKVTPLVGPSSIILAVMASGFNGQSFAFNGYLPIEKNERKSTLKRLEKRAKEENQTQIFIETPYRNNKLLEDMLQILQKDTKISISCDLTLPSEYIKTASVSKWKEISVDLHKRPAIFSIF